MKKSILVVEDQEAIAHVWKLKFSHLGYDVTVEHDGQAGMDAMQKARFDVILLDLNLPHKSGLEILAAKPGSPNAETPVYVITASMDDHEIDQAKQLGATSTFLKYRTNPAEVITTVQEAVGA